MEIKHFNENPYIHCKINLNSFSFEESTYNNINRSRNAYHCEFIA